MRLFVTGGTGFIGRHLVARLAHTEHTLRCLARSTSDVEPLEQAGATIVRGDIVTGDTLAEDMLGCDALVNLAGNFELWVPDRRTYRAVNVQGLRNVMEAALAAGVSKVVHVSTGAIYGNAAWPVREDTPLGPQRASLYAQTKFEGDEVAWRMYDERGLPLVVIYPAAVIGPNDTKAAGRYLRNLARRRMPAQVLVDTPFPWVHVRDVCEAIVSALEKEGNLGEKYLVSASNMTWGEMNALICETAGVRPPALKLPDAATLATAYLLTAVADLLRRPPLLDLSVDQVKLMRQGLEADGGKAERELGLVYTPIQEAVADALASESTNTKPPKRPLIGKLRARTP